MSLSRLKISKGKKGLPSIAVWPRAVQF